MKVILVIGNDKIGRKALKELDISVDNIKIVLDCSTNLKRILKLVRKGALPSSVVFKMVMANFFRENTVVNEEYTKLFTNKCLLKLIDKNTNVIFFRAGLIVNKEVIEGVNNILNIHCAKVPEFGGIGSIQRAIMAKKFEQEATLHKVTTTIDCGEVVDVEPYQMHSSNSYFRNEEVAYSAGIKLLKRTIKNHFGR